MTQYLKTSRLKFSVIFLPAILIPACASSSPAFLMMYSSYRLNKQDDNIQPWCTPSPIWNQSVVLCPVLTVSSWRAYRLKRQVRRSEIPISWRIFHSFLWSTQFKRLSSVFSNTTVQKHQFFCAQPKPNNHIYIKISI